MDEGYRSIIRGVVIGIFAAALISGSAFAYAGVWPPLISVSSDSMEPNISSGDLVVVTEPGRFDSTTSISTHEQGGERNFGGAGDVVIYSPHGGSAVPRNDIIHRAMFQVSEGENWYDRANPDYLPPGAESCESLAGCPSPHDGYITKGDNNPHYDQATGLSEPVKENWIKSEASHSVPFLGYIRIITPIIVGILGLLLAWVSASAIVGSNTEDGNEEPKTEK